MFKRAIATSTKLNLSVAPFVIRRTRGCLLNDACFVQPVQHQLRRCYARLFAASIVNQTSLIPESLITNEKSGAAPLRASNICDDDVIALFAMKEGLASSRSVLGTQPNK